MTNEDTFSIWLVPNSSSDVYKRLEHEIEYWSAKEGGPKFAPHVTLIGGISGSKEQVLAKCEELAQQLRQYYISFSDVAMATTRHQCVFLRCNTEQYVMQAADMAYKVFGLECKPYMPHCSLLYSDNAEEQRMSIVEEARERLYGPLQGYSSLIVETGFHVAALHVYATPFPADEATWQEVGVFELPETE